MRRIITGITLLLLAQHGMSQISLSKYMDSVSTSSSKEYFYKKDWIDSIYISPESQDPLSEISKAIKRSGFNLYVHNERYVFVYPNKLELEKQNLQKEKVRRNQDTDFIRVGDVSNYNADSISTISGLITDESGSPLGGVLVLMKPGEAGTVSDAEGRYTIDILPGNYEATFQYVGREDEVRDIVFYGDGSLDMTLYERGQLLEEVVVDGSSGIDANTATIGRERIGIETIEALPAFLGEVDVVKTATALPGVSTSGESSSYLNVRGGRNDQTLVLMNRAPVYNPGHLLGFLSVFNGDFVSDLTLYKGNIPVKYGTRASSVMDVGLNQWSRKKVNFYGGIGLVNSNLGLKTKLLDDKLDIHVGGRRSYSDWMFGLVPNEDILNSSAWFWDGNLIARYVADDKNTFSLSTYASRDYFKFSDKIIYRIDAQNGSFEWNHLFNNGWTTTSTFIFSNLSNSASGIEVNEKYDLTNGITQLGFTQGLNLTFGPGDLDLGVEANQYEMSPGEIDPVGTSNVIAEELQTEQYRDLSFFTGYNIEFFDHLRLNPGVRYTIFQRMGAATLNEYAPGESLNSNTVIGQREYGSSEVISTYNRLEPRLGLTYSWKNNSINLGYSRTNQYLHLIANTALINPISIWRGSDNFIQPTQIDQYSIGYEVELKNGISLSVESYYKLMDNLIDYKDAAELVLNEELEQAIIAGEGTSYGFEFLLSKPQGAFKGWLSYSYTRAFIQTDDGNESINDGERYPYYSDRPHNIQLNTNYQLTKKWSMGLNFVYLTGAPTNAPNQVLVIDGINVPYFPERNAARIPDYHRLDLSFTLKSRIRKTKNNNDRWVLTLYNVYGRDNASTVFFSRGDDGPAQPFQLISIGSFIPTLTYKFDI